MEDNLTIEKATQMAIDHAESSGVVRSSAFEFLSDEEMDNTETIYSVASLFSQFCDDDRVANTVIVDALADKYGQDYR